MCTQDQESIIKEARIFSRTEIRPFAAKFDADQAIPKDLITKMSERGYLGARFPKEYGGLELDPLHYGLLTEVISKECASTRSVLTVHTSLVGETLMRWGSAEQKERFLPPMASGATLAAFAQSEPLVGSDAGGVKTSYTFDGSNYVINGVKKWITMGAIADVFLVIASEKERTTAFLIERESAGVEVKPIKNLMASRGSHVAEIHFKNVVVPISHRIGREGGGFAYIANTALDYGRFSIAWGGLGIAQGALEAMVTYARKRKQFGKGIYEFQLVQGMIGDAVTKIAAGRSLCVDAAQRRNEGGEESVMQTTLAKYYTSKVANQIASDAVQIHGANGFSTEFPVERLFREAKLLEVIEGTSQLLQQAIAMYGLNEFYDS